MQTVIHIGTSAHSGLHDIISKIEHIGKQSEVQTVMAKVNVRGPLLP